MFRQLAEYVKARFYVPATYSEDGSKISGVRSVKPAHSSINKLVEYFGDRDIAKIDDEAFEKYKARRLKTVSIATVDRELSKARKMFGVALSKKWLFDNRFKTEAGKQLIQVAAEKGAVEHVLSDAEEQRLFKALQKAIVVTQFRCSLQRWRLAFDGPACRVLKVETCQLQG